MCGIVGVLAFGEVEDTKMEKLRQESMIFLATELLQLTQSRGKDATGVAALFSDGNFAGWKMGIPSPDFIARFGETDTDYDGFLKIWRESWQKRKKPVKSFIGHCRKTSVGDADDNNNNHPIKVGDVLGIHNGTLTNYEKIFKKLKCPRDGEVDSEAIVRLVHYMSNKGENPFTIEMMKEVCLRLHGTYSCIMVNGNSPNQVATFRDSRPAEAAVIRSLGILLIASDKDFLKNVLFKYNKMAKLYPTSIAFPTLRKDDVHLELIPDDHAFVWDLSKQMDATTTIDDLSDKERIPRTLADKFWAQTAGTGKTTSVYTGNHGNRNTGFQGNRWNANKDKSVAKSATNQKKTEVDAKSTAAKKSSVGAEDDDDKEAQSTRVWNKSLGVYESKDGVEVTKNIGGVEIDVNKGKVTSTYGGNADATDVEDDKTDDKKTGGEKNLLTLEVVKPEKINKLIGSQAVIEDIPFEMDIEETAKMELEPERVAFNIVDEEKLNLETTEVDLEVDAEAMKKAGELSDKLSKFESDDEVFAALDVTNPKVITEAPLFALVNRIAKHLFKETVAMGYTLRKNEEKAANNIGATKGKNKEQHIIALKEAVGVLSESVHVSHTTYSGRKNVIDKALIKTLNSGRGKNLTSSAFDAIFSAGDFKKHPAIRQLKLSILAKKGEDE